MPSGGLPDLTVCDTFTPQVPEYFLASFGEPLSLYFGIIVILHR